MNSSFPNRWPFSYLKFTKYITNIIAEPKYKFGQQEKATVRNHNRSTLKQLWTLGYPKSQVNTNQTVQLRMMSLGFAGCHVILEVVSCSNSFKTCIIPHAKAFAAINK